MHDPEADIGLGPLLNANGIRPAFVDKLLASEYLGLSPAMLDRMLWASRHTEDKWLEIRLNKVGNRKDKTLLTTRSVEKAAERLLRGELPPRIGIKSLLYLLLDLLSGGATETENDHIEIHKARAVLSRRREEYRREKALEAERLRLAQKAALAPLEKDEDIVFIEGSDRLI